MNKCANKTCNALTTFRYCNDCYQAHKEKLTGTCAKCSCAILSSEKLCKACNPQRKKTCEKCGVSCLKRFCCDCLADHSFSKSFYSTHNDNKHSLGEQAKPIEIKCETCENMTSNKRFCKQCVDEYNNIKLKNICRDCGINRCEKEYCQPCVRKYKASTAMQVCFECGNSCYGRFCGSCIAKYKLEQKKKLEVA